MISYTNNLHMIVDSSLNSSNNILRK